jgi:nitrate reductase alpha subunit
MAMCPVADKNRCRRAHRRRQQVQAVRCGWLPFYPQFTENSLELGQGGGKRRRKTDEEIVAHVVEALQVARLKFADGRPRTTRACFPRRLVHLARQRDHGLGQGPRVLPQALPRHAPQRHRRGGSRRGSSKRVTWHDKAPTGKMDLVVDLNFRMDTSALYSDIVLPGRDLVREGRSQQHRHALLHPPALGRRCPRCGSRRATGRSSRRSPSHQRDGQAPPARAREGHRRSPPLPRHRGRDGAALHQGLGKGECEPSPARHAQARSRRARLHQVYEKFIALGEGNFRRSGLGATAHLCRDDSTTPYPGRPHPVEAWTASAIPRSKQAELAATPCSTSRRRPTASWPTAPTSTIEKTGLDRSPTSPRAPQVRTTYKDLQSQPRRSSTAPSGRAHQRRPGLFRLHLQRGAQRPVAHAHGPPALLPRPRGLHRLRRAPAHLQARADAAAYGDLDKTGGRRARSCSTT